MEEAQQTQIQKRQIAYKLTILDITNGEVIKEGISPGYLKLGNLIVSRVNIIATVVYKSEDAAAYVSALVDDGTGKIMLRSFENKTIFSKVDIGDIVLVIGRIREFNSERYVIAEILKKIDDPDWVSIRKLELKKRLGVYGKKEESKIQEDTSPKINEGICTLIKKFDSGEGAYIEDVIKNSGMADAEEIIKNLLEKGDIFELRPGKLKVLE